MFGRVSNPVAGKFSGNRLDCTSDATSPRSPLEMKSHSPRGLKSYDLGGVGLGIVAALEKSEDFGGRFQACKAFCNKNLSKSNPIPVNSGNNSGRFRGTENEETEMEDSLEEYTFVTCRGFDNKSSYTKVFWDGGEYGAIKVNDWTNLERVDLKNIKKAAVFDISPAKFGDIDAYPDSNFLNSCHLCHKNLHGKDIFMYRGEKAFCSSECRYSEIMKDERKEKCSSSKASRSSVDVSTSPYSSEQIFSAGILAI